MNSSPPRSDVSPELRTLVEKYCAGTLTDLEHAALDGRLHDDAQAQSFFLAYYTVHFGLHWGLRGGVANFASADEEAAENSGRGGSRRGVIREKAPAPVGGFAWGRSTISRTLWAAAIAVLVAGGLVWSFGARTSPIAPLPPLAENTKDMVARLNNLQSSVVVERGGISRAAVAGMALLPDDALRVPIDGSAKLTLANASHVALGPRTTLVFERHGGPVLREGFVQIDATAPQASSVWSIRTPRAKADVRGDRFTLAADPQRTSLRVTEGSVNISRLRDGATVVLPHGHSSTITAHADFHPVPSRYGTALLVVSHDHSYPDWNHFNRLIGDRLLSDRLWRSGFPVEICTFDDLEAVSLWNRPLVIVSLFELGVGAEEQIERSGLHEAAVPVLCLEPAAFPVFGMTGPRRGIDFDFIREFMRIDIARPEHPLSGGLAGAGLDLFTHQTKPSVGWARPADAAVKIAHLHRAPARSMLFAYEQGDAMSQGIAPARRVGLFLNPWGMDEQSPALALVDAAIQWCVEANAAALPDARRETGI